MSAAHLLRAHSWFAPLRGSLAPVTGYATSVDPSDGDRAHAAVSLALRAAETPEILLIRRAEADGDPWSGHMALPGGRRDPADPDLLHTALRETLEETGVALQAHGLALGRLQPLVPATHRLPPISIHPFVFVVPAGTSAHTASLEVAEVLWTPVSELRCPSALGKVDIHLGDVTRTFPCIRVGERVVWGLTYRILEGFFRILDNIEASGPVSPPTPR